MRIHYLLAGLSLAALLSIDAWAADPRLMNLLMPDARLVSGANITNARISPFGQYVLSQITSSMDRDLAELTSATGFDPRQDVSEILSATAGNLTTPSGLVVALGNFNVDRITAALARSQRLQVQKYGDATLVTGTEAKSTFAVAFLGTTIAAFGDSVSVKAAVDRSAGANSINPALATRVQALSTTEDAWSVTLDPISSFVPALSAAPGTAGSPLAGIAQMLGNIQGFSGGVKFGATVDFTAQAIANDAKNAKALADVVQALASIVALGGLKDPQTASLAALLQNLKVTTSDTAINLALSVPEAQLEAMINQMKASQPKVNINPALAPKGTVLEYFSSQVALLPAAPGSRWATRRLSGRLPASGGGHRCSLLRRCLLRNRSRYSLPDRLPVRPGASPGPGVLPSRWSAEYLRCP